MSFRSKLLAACLLLALVPLALFGLRARQQVAQQLRAQYAERVEALADVINQDLERQSAAVAGQLDRLAEAMAADNRLRLAVVERSTAEAARGTDRAYLLDYAGRAMDLTGLDLLRIQDERGRVLSSGHFRNEYGTVDRALLGALGRAGARGALVAARTASGSMLALARARSLRLGARTLTLVGGTAVDAPFLDRLARGTGLSVELRVPGGETVSSGSAGGSHKRDRAGRPTPGDPTATPGGLARGGAIGTPGSRAQGDGVGTTGGPTPGDPTATSGGLAQGDAIGTSGSPAPGDGVGTTASMAAGDATDTPGSAAAPDATGPPGSMAGGAATGTQSRTGAEQGSAPGRASPVQARDVTVPFIGLGQDTIARFVVRASTAPLDAIRRSMDRWLLAMLAAAAGFALLLALAVSAGLSRPLADLARKARRVDLDRLDASFGTTRTDEIGALSRVLDLMTRRLRASAARLREAERRATIGEIARQVNHDVRNGLIPIRNVVSHLAGLARERPAELGPVFLERQGTLESSVEYLHSLAANYARLSPKLDARPCDINTIAAEVVGDASGPATERDRTTRIVPDFAPGLPPVQADPVALRRVVQNLVMNAVESLGPGGGRVLVSTRLDDASDAPHLLLHVADTGHGMTAEQRARIFDDFYTTKPQGTGLGLSIVRRLVNDLGGRISVESEPGEGTRFTIELPAAAGAVRSVDAAGRTRRGAARLP